MPPRANSESGTLALRQLAPLSPPARRGGSGFSFIGSSKSNDRSHSIPGRACLSHVPADGQGIIASAPYGTGYHAPLRPSCQKNQETVLSHSVNATMRSPQNGDLDRKSIVMHSPPGSGPGVSRPSIGFQQGPGASFQPSFGYSSCETGAMGPVLGVKMSPTASSAKHGGHSGLPGSPPGRKPGTGVYMPGSAVASGPTRVPAPNAPTAGHSKGHTSCARASANLSPPSPRQSHHHHGSHHQHHHNHGHHNSQHGNGQQTHHAVEYRGIVTSPGSARQAVTSGSGIKVLPAGARAVHHSSPSAHFESPSDTIRGTPSPRSPPVMAASPRHLAVSPRSPPNQLQSPTPRTPPPFLPLNGIPRQEWAMEALAAAAAASARRGSMGRWQPGASSANKGWSNNMSAVGAGNSTTTSEPFSGSVGHSGHHGPPWSPTDKPRNVQPQQRQAPTSPHCLHAEYSGIEEGMTTPPSKASARCVGAKGQHLGSTEWQQQCFSHFGVDATLREVLDYSIKMQQAQLAAMAGSFEPQATPVSPYSNKGLPPRPGQPTSPKSPLDEALEEEWMRQQIQKVQAQRGLRSPAELQEAEVSGVFLPSEIELGAGWS